MDLTFPKEIEDFRIEVANFVRENLPENIARKVAAERMDIPRKDQQTWHKILHAKGWSTHGWPVEYGGQDWSDAKSYVFEREMALGNAPRPQVYGVGMLAPSIMEFGTPEQLERFLPPIANGDVMWCQGFSEPNAGSDLASLQCKADLDGDHYVINGTKTWTSEGHISDWMFGLFRTDSTGRKQQGITVLLFDLKTPGITMTPIITYDGIHEVNQVFFDDVRVPLNNRLGEHDAGWSVAKFMLGLERFGTAEVSRSLASLARAHKMANAITINDQPLIDDPVFAAKIAEVEIELRALEITEQRFLFQSGGSDALGAEASMLKIRGTEIQQRIYELMVEALGYDAQVAIYGEDLSASMDTIPSTSQPGTGHYPRAYFNFRKTSIYAGSNEIQKTIIAKAVLGL